MLFLGYPEDRFGHFRIWIISWSNTKENSSVSVKIVAYYWVYNIRERNILMAILPSMPWFVTEGDQTLITNWVYAARIWVEDLWILMYSCLQTTVKPANINIFRRHGGNTGSMMDMPTERIHVTQGKYPDLSWLWCLHLSTFVNPLSCGRMDRLQPLSTGAGQLVWHSSDPMAGAPNEAHSRVVSLICQIWWRIKG